MTSAPRRESASLTFSAGIPLYWIVDLEPEPKITVAFSRARFEVSYRSLPGTEDACLLVATDGRDYLGYLLGFRHLIFFANGPAG